MQYSIRALTTSDFDELLRLFQEFAHFEKRPDQMKNTVANMAAEAPFLLGFVVEDNNQVLVGYVTYFYTYHTWSGKGMYMDDLYVQEQHRGQGLGKMLLEKVIELAEAESCHNLRWLVSNWNTKAMDFYESIGADITNNELQCELTFQ